MAAETTQPTPTLLQRVWARLGAAWEAAAAKLFLWQKTGNTSAAHGGLHAAERPGPDERRNLPLDSAVQKIDCGVLSMETIFCTIVVSAPFAALHKLMHSARPARIF